MMNVSVYARVRPPDKDEAPPTLNVSDENTLASSQQQTAMFHRFQALYDHTTRTDAIYHDIILPMLDQLVAGLNCSLLCFGESSSGKTYTLTGEESTGIDGVIQMTMRDLFDKTNTGYGASSSTNFTNAAISISMYELYNESIRDLMKEDGLEPAEEGTLPLDISAEQGLHIKDLISVQVSSESDAINALKKGMASRNTRQTDYGPAHTKATVFTTLTLTLEKPLDGSYPHHSTFTFIDLPGSEKIADDYQQLRKREGMVLNKSLLSLGPLVEELANERTPNRIIKYSESQLCRQLSDILGGNCQTKVLMHFKPQSSERLLDITLTLARHMTQVINYPVINDAATMGLITQYRAKILYIKRQLGQTNVEPTLTSDELQETNIKLSRENQKLKEEKKYFERKLEQLHSRFEDSAGDKSDLSAKLIASEEERLKVSKTLVDVKIENNRLRERAAQETFELNNKLISMDGEFSHIEMEKTHLSKENNQMRQRLRYLETDKKDVADKYVQLNADYRALIRKYDQEVSRNQELGLELLNLLHARVTLLKQQDNLARADITGTNIPSPVELNKVRDIAMGMSTYRSKAEDIASTEMERLDIEKKIFGNQERFRQEMELLKSQYDEQQDQLKTKITDLTSAVKRSMETARSAQHKLAQQQVEVVMLRDQTKRVQTTNGQLQLQLKDKNSELKSKLTKYIQDIAEYVDARANTFNRPIEQQLTEYVKEMVKDLKKTYVSREKQLSDAVRGYRSQAHRVAKKHEQLLVMYRMLKMEEGAASADHHPPAGEVEFALLEDDLESANRKEITKLEKKLKETQQQLAQLQLQSPKGAGSTGWKALEKQLQEFTQNTQHELERERAALMSNNAILEEQLTECRHYIDTHLKEYKDEISKLRHQLQVQPREGYGDTAHNRRHPRHY